MGFSSWPRDSKRVPFGSGAASRTHRTRAHFRRPDLSDAEKQDILARLGRGFGATSRGPRLATRGARPPSEAQRVAAEEFCWHVARVWAGDERAAAEDLTEMGFCGYAPMRREIVERARIKGLDKRVKRRIERPVFPGYVFVGTTGAPVVASLHESLLDVLGGAAPVRVASRVIAALNARELSGEWDRTGAARRFCKGERVVVVEGPFRDLQGIVDELPNDLRVAIELELFGRATKVVVEAGQLASV